ncbi:DUF1493 family protein [Hymenobacter sp. CRA2]|uniref:DUF1493 family protein n=1 Tax=Hymenobacter sp. CRA2 TaxID=1955620 RepID=UPI001115E26D|nr:DUF1493 family protein [Hymenobacter sp. CRA2]
METHFPSAPRISWSSFQLFVAAQTSCETTVLTTEASVEEDMGVTGMEAEDLVKDLAVRFGIDVSGFVYEDYFYPEPHLFLDYSRYRIKPLKLGDLYQAALTGRLV